MPINKKLFELENGQKVWVRQASGLEKLKVEGIHATCLRKCRAFGPDIQNWTDEQQDEYWDLVEEMGGGLTAQIEQLIPLCLMSYEDGTDVDVNNLKSEEIMPMLAFIRGDATAGEGDAVPLGN